MCHPSDLCTAVTIILDASGGPVGLTVTHHWFSDHEATQPLDVGPFDTPGEALNAALGVLTIQKTLFEDHR